MITISLLLVVCLLLSFIHLRYIEKAVQTKIDYTQQIKKVSNLRWRLFKEYPYPFKKSKEDLESDLRKLEEERGVLSQLSAVMAGKERTRKTAFWITVFVYLITFFLITQPSFSAEYLTFFFSAFAFLLIAWPVLATFARKGENSADISAELEIIHN